MGCAAEDLAVEHISMHEGSGLLHKLRSYIWHVSLVSRYLGSALPFCRTELRECEAVLRVSRE